MRPPPGGSHCTAIPAPNSAHSRIERAPVLRGERVILDADLAALYGVETKALNRAVKRNGERFPSDFMFRLTDRESVALRCQIGTSNLTELSQRGGRRYPPHAFTEHGAIMAANVLNSPRAVSASVAVVRAFVRLPDGDSFPACEWQALVGPHELLATADPKRPFARLTPADRDRGGGGLRGLADSRVKRLSARPPELH